MTDVAEPDVPSTAPSDPTASPPADHTDHDIDMCRVCRTESAPNRPLFYPCVCTGSIKYIHQECLLEWLKYSKKEYCELCKHKYTFQPIYHPDMPAHLPMREFATGLGRQVGRAVKCWLIYTLVACAWLGVVPLAACRIYRAIFQGSLPALLTLPFDLFSLDHIATDILHGASILGVFLCSFIWLVWLSEQITHGAPHHELNLDDEVVPEDMDLHHDDGHVHEEDVPAEEPAEPAVADEASQEEMDKPSTSTSTASASTSRTPGDRMSSAPSTSSAAASPTSTSSRARASTDSSSSDNDESDGTVDEEQPHGDGGEPAAAAEENDGDQPAADDGANENEDANWFDNWERRGEELSWERLLGFDGSFAFLEHIFWVISFNTLFTITFAYIPYHVGLTIARACKATWLLSASRFGGALSALVGYLCVCMCVYVMHAFARLCRFKRLHKATGTCYLMIKVFLLVLAEAGLFPLMCGWWLDICSLNLFSATLQQRKISFAHAPGTSTFIHWLLGMLYVFYCASFVLVLRDVLRPGTLWFLRNLNDPNFNPIQEMLTLPVRRHLRRLLASLVLFMVTIMLVVYIPVKLIRFVIPHLLPYNITPTRETPMGELSLELLLLQVIVPALLEQSQARTAAKACIRWWCQKVGGWLDLTSYLLGEEKAEDNPEPQGDGAVLEIENAEPAPVEDPANQQVAVVDGAQPEVDVAPPVPPRPAPAAVEGNNLAAEHHALLMGGEPAAPHTTYKSPDYFGLRVTVLLLSLAMTTIVWSTTALCLPVALGRLVIALLGGGDAQVHELYTVSTGLYVCYIVGHGTAHTYRWLAQEWQAIRAATINALVLCGKCTIACLGLLVLLPLLMGIAFQLVLFTPLRVNANQSPLYFPIQDWAMGVLHFKVLCAMVTMGPDWWLKRVFERLYNDGVRELDLVFLYKECVWPVASALMLFIAAPYVAAFGAAPMLGVPTETCIALQRNLYMCIVFFVSLTAFLVWQAKRIGRLVLRIRDEKYLLGQRLMNYEREMAKKEESEQLSIEA